MLPKFPENRENNREFLKSEAGADRHHGRLPVSGIIGHYGAILSFVNFWLLQMHKGEPLKRHVAACTISIVFSP
jgi:hypothetical protein